MRFYRRDRDDKLNSINRCFFDAQNGRVELAIVRITDLHDEFPDDSQISYAEGLLHLDYLGEGNIAWNLFKQAYELDPTHSFAAYNTAVFSPTQEEYLHWIEIARAVNPDDSSLTQMAEGLQGELEAGTPYQEILLALADHRFSAESYGRTASILDIVLDKYDFDQVRQRDLHRLRAESLRLLDKIAQRQLEGLGEQFLAKDRLALIAAVTEIDRTLAIDEYDPELWNFKSAWCMLLQRHTDAITCADRAIALRPHGYAKPHQNKAMALLGLKRLDEARHTAEMALNVARSADSAVDIAMVESLIQNMKSHPPNPTLDSLEPLFDTVIHKSMLLSEEEESRGQKRADPRENLEVLAQGLMKRAGRMQGVQSSYYVPLMAELLVYVTPETAYWVLARVLELSPEVNDHCMHATLYLVAHSSGVMQRDAARLLSLFFFTTKKAQLVRRTYRLAVLEPSQASPAGPMKDLDEIMRDELRRFHPDLPHLIADQEPVDSAGVERATRNVLNRFDGHAETGLHAPSSGSGCAVVMGLFLTGLTVLLLSLAYFR